MPNRFDKGHAVNVWDASTKCIHLSNNHVYGSSPDFCMLLVDTAVGTRSVVSVEWDEAAVASGCF